MNVLADDGSIDLKVHVMRRPRAGIGSTYNSELESAVNLESTPPARHTPKVESMEAVPSRWQMVYGLHCMPYVIVNEL